MEDSDDYKEIFGQKDDTFTNTNTDKNVLGKSHRRSKSTINGDSIFANNIVIEDGVFKELIKDKKVVYILKTMNYTPKEGEDVIIVD